MILDFDIWVIGSNHVILLNISNYLYLYLHKSIHSTVPNVIDTLT